jgi:hypothetical protein
MGGVFFVFNLSESGYPGFKDLQDDDICDDLQ